MLEKRWHICPGGFMNIVIVGCGKVGMVITKLLSSEDHNITLVDEDSEAIAAVTNHYDAMGGYQGLRSLYRGHRLR